MSLAYEKAKQFKEKYPLTVAWRLKEHAKIIDEHLNPDEEVLYAFACQKNSTFLGFFTTCLVALTNKRIMIAQKRVVFGYFFTSITPDLYNDLKVNMGIFWGKVKVDTIKELVVFAKIQRSALNEIETNITEYMMKRKKQIPSKIDECGCPADQK